MSDEVDPIREIRESDISRIEADRDAALAEIDRLRAERDAAVARGTVLLEFVDDIKDVTDIALDDSLTERILGFFANPSPAAEELLAKAAGYDSVRYGKGCTCDPPGSGEEWCVGTCYVKEMLMQSAFKVARAERYRAALEDCLHTIGGSWLRYGVPPERWAVLKAFTGERFPDDWTNGERQWWHAYQSFKRGSDAINAEPAPAPPAAPAVPPCDHDWPRRDERCVNCGSAE